MTVTRLTGWEAGVRFQAGAKILRHSLQRTSSHLSSGSRGLFPRGWRGQGMNLTIHPHLVLRLRMRGAILPLPHTSSLR